MMNSILLFVTACILNTVSTLYFHISETEKKCFIEDIPEDTLVVGKYKVEVYDENSKLFAPSASGFGMNVEIKDPHEKVILNRVYGAEGRYTFTSNIAGEHVICLHGNTTTWFSGARLRVHLNIDVGERANNYEEIASKDKLTELQLRVRQLLDQVEMIAKEQNYQRYREERFRETSESTNTRVLYWAIFQLVVLILTGCWQMRHLKGFFEAKKLV